MIELDRVGFTYDGDTEPTLRDVTLFVDEGELVLLVGRTGVGKSTLLGTFNGLVPHFTGGHLDGTVAVAGVSTRSRPPRELAHLVGYVGQDPLAGFVTDTAEDELAYGMEQLGVDPQTMRRRVEETLDLLGIADLRGRALRTLSGGQQQRVAIGSVLTMHPPVLVLDEPTSALDPTAAEEVLATLARLVHDLGTTVVLAEHRMERVVPFADRMLWIGPDGRVVDGEPSAILRETPIAPPVVELGRLAGWDPLPLTVRDARRRAGPLRAKLDDPGPRAGRHQNRASSRTDPMTSPRAEVLRADGVTVRYGSTVAVRGASVTLDAGDVLAVMGRNGSGKSSLLWAIQGAGARHGGMVTTDGRVGMVPQTASDLLYLESVREECEAGDREADVSPGTCRALLERFAAGVPDDHHPRDLSEGQKLALVLAVQLAAAPRVLLLDEPTRGLDYTAKAALAVVVGALSSQGCAVVIATHDVEFVASVAGRAVVMADGEVIADGTAVDVVGGSPAFAPQVAKILGPPWLTVDDVRGAL